MILKPHHEAKLQPETTDSLNYHLTKENTPMTKTKTKTQEHFTRVNPIIECTLKVQSLTVSGLSLNPEIEGEAEIELKLSADKYINAHTKDGSKCCLAYNSNGRWHWTKKMMASLANDSRNGDHWISQAYLVLRKSS
jgi:hypothetical protein